MTVKNLREDNNFYSIKKDRNKYYAFSQSKSGMYGVSIYDDIFCDGTYLVYSSGALDTTLQNLYFWLHGHYGFEGK